MALVLAILGMIARPVAALVFYFASTPPPRGPTPAELKVRDDLLAILSPANGLICSLAAAAFATLAAVLVSGKAGRGRR